MRSFFCRCGQRVFFDSTQCLRCGEPLGFDPDALDIRVVEDPWRRCANGDAYGVCNWLVPVGGPAYCGACALNELVPNLDSPDNVLLWGRLEAAKQRLVYNLLSLGLNVQPGGGHAGLRFRFLEDRRRNPDVLEEFVTTGHHSGTVTMNLLEADDVHRTAAREAMQERYRTLLGHFRHESGHFFFDRLVTPAHRGRFRALFGDERMDYPSCLEAYYRDGPPPDWHVGYVSAYASSHPHEDWAESFAHYLHIQDALETAVDAGLAPPDGGHEAGWLMQWMRLSVMLNELNRSLGIEDAYPFVLGDRVVGKLEFIDRLVCPPAGSPNAGTAGAAAG